MNFLAHPSSTRTPTPNIIPPKHHYRNNFKTEKTKSLSKITKNESARKSRQNDVFFARIPHEEKQVVTRMLTEMYYWCIRGSTMISAATPPNRKPPVERGCLAGKSCVLYNPSESLRWRKMNYMVDVA